MTLGMGLILHSETWYSLDMLIPRYSLTKVASPLRSDCSFNYKSKRLVSMKLMGVRLKQLFIRTRSLSAPCIILSMFSLWSKGFNTCFRSAHWTPRQSTIKSPHCPDNCKVEGKITPPLPQKYSKSKARYLDSSNYFKRQREEDWEM